MYWQVKINLTFLLVLIFWGMSFLIARPDAFAQAALSNKESQKNNQADDAIATPKKKYTLKEVKEGKIYLLDELQLDEYKKWNVDFKTVVLDLIKQTNRSVILHLAKSLELQDNKDGRTSLSTGNILTLREALLKNLSQTENTNITTKSLIGENLLGGSDGVILKSADVFEYYNNKLENVTESHIVLHGNVSIVFSGYTVTAQQVTLNADKKLILFAGNVVIQHASIEFQTEKYIIDLNDDKGFAFDFKGRQLNNYYRGEIIKFNSQDHITIENARLTFTSNQDPHYFIYASEYNRYGADTTQIDNISFFVHNHPFFYFPFFMQADYDFGINFSFGNTQHEGYYILFDISTKLGLLGDVGLTLNAYEKLGTYVRLVNKRNWQWQEYNLDVAYARYLVNENITINPLSYTFHATDRLDQDVRNRYRIDYSHSLNLADASNAIFKNTLQWKIKEVTDPFFSSDLERRLPSFDIFDFFLNPDAIEERLYQRRATDVKGYSLAYALQTTQINFQLQGNWNYANHENKEILDVNASERWESALNRIIFPSTRVEYADVLDPLPKKLEEHTRSFYLDTSYKINLHYVSEEHYKSIKPYPFERHVDNLNLSTSASKNWHLNQEAKVNKIVSSRYNSSASFGYQKQWGGEELGNNYINNNYRNTFFNLGFSQGVIFYLPAFKARNEWLKSYDIRAMLPVWQLGADYRLNLKSEPDDQGLLELNFDTYAAHQVNLNSTINWNWYGLFFIPYFDVKHDFKTIASYSLLPEKNNEDEYLDVEFNLERLFYFTSELSSKGNWAKIFHFDNDLKMRFFDPVTKEMNYSLQENHFRLKWVMRNMLLRKGLLTRFNILIDYNWQYFFLKESYLNDYMNAKLVFALKFIEHWDVTFTLITENNQASRYFGHKAEEINFQRVDFFTDLSGSLGLLGFEEQKQGLFKFKGLDVSVYHDLDSWYARLSYSFYPVVLPSQTGSVKGFYFDHRVAFEINIKLDAVSEEVRKLRGLLPDLKRNFKPPIFDNL